MRQAPCAQFVPPLTYIHAYTYMMVGLSPMFMAYFSVKLNLFGMGFIWFKLLPYQYYSGPNILHLTQIWCNIEFREDFGGNQVQITQLVDLSHRAVNNSFYKISFSDHFVIALTLKQGMWLLNLIQSSKSTLTLKKLLTISLQLASVQLPQALLISFTFSIFKKLAIQSLVLTKLRSVSLFV